MTTQQNLLRGPSPSSSSGSMGMGGVTGYQGMGGVTGYQGTAGSTGRGPGVDSDTYRFYKEVFLTRRFIVLKDYVSEITPTDRSGKEVGEVNLPAGTKITGSQLAVLFAKDTCNMPEKFRFANDTIMAINEEKNVVNIRIMVTDHNFAKGFLLKETLFTEGSLSWDDRSEMISTFMYLVSILAPEQAVQVVATTTEHANGRGPGYAPILNVLMKAVLSGYFKEDI